MRITKAILEAKIATINKLTGSPAEPYTKGADGSFKANIRNYNLSCAYGGYSLQRMVGEGGGVTCPLNTGHVPARELALALDGFIAGLRAAQ